MTVTTCPIPGCTTVDDLGNKLLITTPLCHQHTASLATVIRRLPRIYTELNMQMQPANNANNDPDRVKASKEKPLGINTENRALQQDILRIIRDVERILRLDRDWPPTPKRGREGPQLLEGARFVEKHLDPILDLNIRVRLHNEWVPFPQAMFDLARNARHALGLTNPPDRLPHPCPSCDCKSLQRANGASEIRCAYAPCGRVFTEDDYDRLVLILTYGETA